LLASFKIGQPYSEAEKVLGEPYLTLTEPEDVKNWGNFIFWAKIKNDKIYTECNLHMFLRMDFMPHRFILIYENKKTHLIEDIAWKYT
jgi:hypothetical protein